MKQLLRLFMPAKQVQDNEEIRSEREYDEPSDQNTDTPKEGLSAQTVIPKLAFDAAAFRERLTPEAKRAIDDFIESVREKKQPAKEGSSLEVGTEDQQKALVVGLEQKPETLEESLEALYGVLRANGKDAEASNLEDDIGFKSKEAQQKNIKGLLMQYNPQNNDDPNAAEIFQKLLNVRSAINERSRAETITSLATDLAANFEGLSPELKAVIEQVKQTLRNPEMPKAEIDKNWGDLINLVNTLDEIKASQEIATKVNELVVSAFSDQTTKETNTQAARPDVVKSESNSNQEKRTEINSLDPQNSQEEPYQDLEEEKKKRKPESNENSINHNFYNSSSTGFDANAIAITTAKLSAALAVALSCGPFGWILAAMMLYSIRNVGNNLSPKGYTNSGKGLGDEIESNAMQKAIAQLQQQLNADKMQRAPQPNHSQIEDLNQPSPTRARSSGEEASQKEIRTMNEGSRPPILPNSGREQGR